MTPSEHLSAADLAAYIDRALPFLGRERAERHLSDCVQCREELAACAPLAASAPSRRRTGILLSGAGIAAVAAAVLVAVVAIPRAPSPDATRQRAPATSPIRELAIVSPRPGARVTAGEIRFVWRADSGAVGYSVIVTTPGGTLVWSKDVPDTSAAPPREVTFVDGEEYNWRIESTHVSGGTLASAHSSFKVVSR